MAGYHREDNAVWWPTGITTDQQQNLHHQHLLNQHHQQQLQQQQQQIQHNQVQQQQNQQQQTQAAINEAVARSNSTTSTVATQQLFSYKMASSFPSTTMAGVTVSTSNSPVGAYDYRLGTMNTLVARPGDPQAIQTAAPGTQWWYTAAAGGQNPLENIQHQQVAAQQQQQQQTQQNHQQHQQAQQVQHSVHTPPTQNQTHHQPAQHTTQNNQIAQKMGRGKNADSKPRGRMTAYAFFVQTCREEHKKKHPEESVIFAEFSRKCAERWKTMLDKEKKRFHEMAEKDKARYDLEMSNYVPPKGVIVGRGKKRKHLKDPNAPKRSLSAFFWFCHDERTKVKALNPEYGVGDIAKELGRKWSDVDAEHKSRYEAMADKDKQRYEREMTEYKLKCRNAQQGIVPAAAQPAAVQTPMNLIQQQQQHSQQQQIHHQQPIQIQHGQQQQHVVQQNSPHGNSHIQQNHHEESEDDEDDD